MYNLTKVIKSDYFDNFPCVGVFPDPISQLVFVFTSSILPGVVAIINLYSQQTTLSYFMVSISILVSGSTIILHNRLINVRN